MSNENIFPTGKVKSARWRMPLPLQIQDTIKSIAADEDRDPGEIVARWVKDYFKLKFSTQKEGQSG